MNTHNTLVSNNIEVQDQNRRFKPSINHFETVMLKPIGERKLGVPTRLEMYNILKKRSEELQKQWC